MNEATAVIAEYFQLKTLAKLGFSFDGEKLDDYKAKQFLMIASKIDKLEKRKRK